MARSARSGVSINGLKNSKTKNNSELYNTQIKILSVLLLLFSILLLIAFISYTPSDSAYTRVTVGELFGLLYAEEAIMLKADMTQNWLGLVGAFLSEKLFTYTVGFALFPMPLIFIWISTDLYKQQKIEPTTLKYTVAYLNLAVLFAAIVGIINTYVEDMSIEWYGNIGIYVGDLLSALLGRVGALLILFFSSLFTIYLATDIKLESMFNSTFSTIDFIKEKSVYFWDMLKKDTEETDINTNDSSSESKSDEKQSVTKVETSSEVSKDGQSSTQNAENTKEIKKLSIHKPIEVPENNDQEEKSTSKQKPSVNANIPPSARAIKISYNTPKNVFTSFENDESELEKDDVKLIENIENDANYQTPADENFPDSSANEIQYIEQYVDSEKVNEPAIDAKSETVNPAVNLNSLEEMVAKVSDNENVANKEKNISNISQDEFDLLSELEAFNKSLETGEEFETKSAVNISIEKSVIKPDELESVDVRKVTVNENVTAENKDIDSKSLQNSRYKHLNVVINTPPEEKFNSALTISSFIHDEEIKFQRPALSLLKEDLNEIKIDEKELESNATILQEKLETFKIYIENLSVTPGPVVTQYEFVPAAGIKISKIESLADDLAMALKARGIRIIAPIPGKGTVGVEIPNLNPSVVRFHSIISSKEFQESKAELPLGLGKTISGEVIVADLMKMPHLLIAGSTGSGKSVGINTIMASLLYKKSPSELKFIIIDPKKVELRQYSRLESHFMATSPDVDDVIVTKPEDAVTILKAAVLEMEKRYDILAHAGCRNILEYNDKVGSGKLKEDDEIQHRKMPFIVIVIDELADLMLTASKEIEEHIARLAQMARAVGMHLILATQRPSVDVITGVIKANFPSRIAYLVASKIDSRTILDMTGADQLLGNGDMLFLPSGAPKPLRIQNAYISTDEVDNICDFVGEQKGYSQTYQLPSVDDGKVSKAGTIDAADRDSLFEEAAKIFINQQQASVSLLQRKLKIGYARAGRIVDELESAGVVGPFDGSKSRIVLIDSFADLERIL